MKVCTANPDRAEYGLANTESSIQEEDPVDGLAPFQQRHMVDLRSPVIGSIYDDSSESHADSEVY